MPTATGVQEISNSNFDGVNTAISLNNMQTVVSSTTINDATTGISTGTQSGASYTFNDVTMTAVETGILSRGTGEIDVNRFINLLNSFRHRDEWLRICYLC